MSLGTVAAVSTADGIAGLVSTAGTVLLLWATLTLTFVLGMGVTIAVLGLIRQGIPGRTLVAALGVAIGAAVLGGLDVVAYTPYGVFLGQSLPRVGGTLAAIAGVFLVGALTFDVSARRATG